jgi:hypothetical protein
MNPADSKVKDKFWQRLRHELINGFTHFLSGMAEAFLAPETCLPASILERTKVQTEKTHPVFILPVTSPKISHSLLQRRIWFCSSSIEISLCAIPAKTPIGMLKLLDILRNCIREQSI